jgi:long-chain fatty acid transport protein
MRSGSYVVAILAVLLASGKAAASTELNGLFDARSMAMGGTGVAWLDSGGAVPTNPALLEQTKHLSLTLNAFLFISQPEAPYRITHVDASGRRFENFETVRSSTIFAPLGFLGMAYRLSDRIVIGVGAGPIIGQGTSAKYRPAPELRPDLEIENEAALGLLELGNAVSVRVTDTLSLGATWRITYMTQSVSTPLPGNALGGTLLGRDMNPIYADINVTGLNLTGFQLGVFWKPASNVRFGLSYRSKVTVDGEGTTKSLNPISGEELDIETKQPFPSPHAFRAGLALTVLDDKLTFATDVKYLMYAEAFKTLPTTTTRDGVESTTQTPANWIDAYNVHLGSEYKASESLALRAGYILSTTATPEAFAKAFMAPPGVAHCWTAGFGVALGENFNLDMAGSIVVLRTKIETATKENAGVGVYASHTGELSLSATYHN